MTDEDGEARIEDLLDGLARYRQRVAELLPQMYREGHPKLNSTLAYAHEAGYTLEALGSMLSLSRERIRQRVVAGDPAPRTPFRASTEEIASLCQLRSEAEGRNPSKRRGTAQYRAFLADLRERGASLSYLGLLLGVTDKAVAQQLKRHYEAGLDAMGAPHA